MPLSVLAQMPMCGSMPRAAPNGASTVCCARVAPHTHPFHAARADRAPPSQVVHIRAGLPPLIVRASGKGHSHLGQRKDVPALIGGVGRIQVGAAVTAVEHHAPRERSAWLKLFEKTSDPDQRSSHPPKPPSGVGMGAQSWWLTWSLRRWSSAHERQPSGAQRRSHGSAPASHSSSETHEEDPGFCYRPAREPCVSPCHHGKQPRGAGLRHSHAD
jgi:hypothetical protein